MYDVVGIRVQAGKGGDGAISFRHEKFVPYGGPDGGDGGQGGDVVVQADPSITSLKLFRNRSLHKAPDGDSGRGRKQFGKNGADLLVKVPVGTTVYEEAGEEKRLIADLDAAAANVVVAKGGRGGFGNVHFANATNQTPRLAQAGDDGEKKSLLLEMRAIADAGIIGFPNAGKSSLLAAASRAKPKIADYPFTTTEPELGVVEVDGETMVLAEIPGLIEGAHQGRGLGHDFLRHSTRTRVFIHLIDGSSASPVENMISVNNELHLYDPALARKPQIVAINKVDLPAVRERLEELQTTFAAAGVKTRAISAATGEGVLELMKAAHVLLKQTAPPVEAPEEMKVFRPQPRHARTSIEKDGQVYVIVSEDILRVVKRVDMPDPSVMRQVRGFLMRRGVARELENAGIKPGDKVRCGDIEWTW